MVNFGTASFFGNPGDFDGDGKTDVAGSITEGSNRAWYYVSSLNPTQNVLNTRVPFGDVSARRAQGDYDGDGKNDFVVQRNNGGGQAAFWTLLATGVVSPNVVFGTPTDVFVPGDYDGDGKTDFVARRNNGGAFQWYIFRSSDGARPITNLGIAGEP